MSWRVFFGEFKAEDILERKLGEGVRRSRLQLEVGMVWNPYGSKTTYVNHVLTGAGLITNLT